MEIHLDLMGGLAGDMFVAALLDAFPDQEAAVVDAVSSFSPIDGRLACSVVEHHDGTSRGRRFDVHLPSRSPTSSVLRVSDSHSHTTWNCVREQIRASRLTSGAKQHAVGIFALLAQAEASVHGVSECDVSFHEVGAWDSIADIVGAAVLIDELQATRWTSSPAPLGGGRVQTAHGILPLPAPATAQLLLGLPTIDDGIDGERVTPTGAAILRYLCPPTQSSRANNAQMRRLLVTGLGFGTRVLPGISNCVRALGFEPSTQGEAIERRRLQVIEFEVDDQSGEDLAMGLELLRAHGGVLDVTQCAVFGKKGRMTTHVQVLARDASADEVIELCFRETTTIGLRRHRVEGIGLQREVKRAAVDGEQLRVKLVERPGGRTAKTESEDVRRTPGHFARARLKSAAESAVINEHCEQIDA